MKSYKTPQQSKTMRGQQEKGKFQRRKALISTLSQWGVDSWRKELKLIPGGVAGACGWSVRKQKRMPVGEGLGPVGMGFRARQQKHFGRSWWLCFLEAGCPAEDALSYLELGFSKSTEQVQKFRGEAACRSSFQKEQTAPRMKPFKEDMIQ